jgi:hypothetical protein
MDITIRLSAKYSKVIFGTKKIDRWIKVDKLNIVK